MIKWDTWRGLIPPPSPALLVCILLFGSVVLLIPNGIDARDQRYINLALIAFFCVSLFMAKVSLSLSVLLLYVFIGFFFQGHFDMMNVQVIVVLSVFYLFIVHWIERGRFNVDVVYDALCVFALINVVWQVLQYFGIYVVLQADKMNYLAGLMSNTNDLAALYACLIPAFFRKKRVPFVIIPVAGLIMSGGRAGAIASVLAALAFILFTARLRDMWKWCAFVLVGVVAFSVFVNPLRMFQHKDYRLTGWAEFLPFAFYKPYVGWGYGQFRFIVPLITSAKFLPEKDKENIFGAVRDQVGLIEMVQSIKKKYPSYFQTQQWAEPWVQAHNEYIETFFNLGAIGLLLGLLALIRHLWVGAHVFDVIPFCGLLAASVTAFFFFTWHIIPMAIVTVFYMAVIKGDMSVFKRIPNTAGVTLKNERQWRWMRR